MTSQDTDHQRWVPQLVVRARLVLHLLGRHVQGSFSKVPLVSNYTNFKLYAPLVSNYTNFMPVLPCGVMCPRVIIFRDTQTWTHKDCSFVL